MSCLHELGWEADAGRDTVTRNNDSGFGRVNLANSLTMACRENGAGFLVDTIREPSKQESTIEITSKRLLKVTLVWSDFPGKELTQKLRLIVLADGTLRHGNMGNDDSGFDNDNNVQQVIWDNIPLGTVRIIVWAHDTPKGS